MCDSDMRYMYDMSTIYRKFFLECIYVFTICNYCASLFIICSWLARKQKLILISQTHSVERREEQRKLWLETAAAANMLVGSMRCTKDDAMAMLACHELVMLIFVL